MSTQQVSKEATATMTSTSPLLALPAELRNQVYQYVVCANPVIRVTPTGHIILPTLAATCKQVRGEFLQILDETLPERAETIEAVVLNYDFAALRIALNMPGLDDRTGGEAPTLNLTLNFCRAKGSKLNAIHGLKTWLRFCQELPEDAMKLGTCVVDLDASETSILHIMRVLAFDAHDECQRKAEEGKLFFGKKNGCVVAAGKLSHAMAVARIKVWLWEEGVMDLPENVGYDDLTQGHYIPLIERRIKVGEW